MEFIQSNQIKYTSSPNNEIIIFNGKDPVSTSTGEFIIYSSSSDNIFNYSATYREIRKTSSIINIGDVRNIIYENFNKYCNQLIVNFSYTVTCSNITAITDSDYVNIIVRYNGEEDKDFNYNFKLTKQFMNTFHIFNIYKVNTTITSVSSYISSSIQLTYFPALPKGMSTNAVNVNQIILI